MCVFELKEPILWQKILLKLNNFAHSNYYLQKGIPFFADAFVFTYPIFLIFIYLYWLYYKQSQYNFWAIYIFFSAMSSIAVNLIIQQIVCKKRPEQLILSQNDLIFKHVPNNPFPSDHAALSAAIGFSTLFWWLRTNDKFFIYFWIIFIFISFFMSICRVAAGVHWPTDILMWWLVGFVVSLLLISPCVYWFLYKVLYIKLYNLSLWLFRIKL